MTASTRKTSALAAIHANRGMLFPLGCVSLLLVLLIPLPTGVLDLLLVLNLTLSVIVLVTTLHVKSAREFAVFPSLLLAITLFRLVLNVATTRLILSGNGTDSSAGQVVRAFSNFVTNDSVTVGAIIFLIIFVIQFVVITKGGSRISEVAARFVLDAMPGKQMAIDADVNAGLITQQQAHDRREVVAREADFYAAMDGAGKFVRGDAIAGIIIVIVNIVGGFYIGMSKHGMDFATSMDLYTRLTIGDGLISQIPAFIVSLAAGLIVTRSSGDSDLGEDVIAQMLSKPRALIVAAVFLVVLAFTGLPKLPLLIMCGCCVGLAYTLIKKPDSVHIDEIIGEPAKEEAGAERLLDLDVLELELGAGLVRLADREHGGDLLERLTAIRELVALEMGILVPPTAIRDNQRLDINDYAVKIKGQTVARGVAYPDQFMAIDDGGAERAITGGDETAEPSRGRLAYWITESQRDEAERLGYVIVEAPAAIVNHLAEIIRTHAHELLTRQGVKNLLDHLRSRASAVVEEVVPQQIKPGELQKVMQNLLRERVPVRDLETILETLGDHAGGTKDINLLTEHVRIALARTICRQHVDQHDGLACIMLDASLEELILGHVEHGGSGGDTINTMPPETAQQIGQAIADQAALLTREGRSPVVLCAPAVRLAVRRLIEPIAPQVAVLSLAEVTSDVAPEVVAVVREDHGHGTVNGTRGNGDTLHEEGYEPANL